MATETRRHKVKRGKRFSRRFLFLFSSVALWLRGVETIIALGLMVVMAGATLAYGAVEPWSLATVGLSIIALLVLWVIKGLVDRRLEISAPSTALPLVALISLGVLQGMRITDSAGKRFSISLDAEATRLATEVLLILLIAFLLSANFLAKAPALTWLRNFLIFFGLALSVFGLIQRFTWNGKFYWMIELSAHPPAPFGPFVNHNHFAGYVEMIAPIPVALILRRAVRGEWALLYGFAAAMMGLAVVMSLSRGGMISLVAGLMFVVAFGFRGSGKRRIEDRWALGVGIGAYQTAYPIYSSHDGTLVVGQAHNDYLQIMADAGIFGAVIAAWFIFLVARDALRASRHGNRVMSGTALGAAGGIFALFVHSLFDFNLQIPSNALLFIVLTSVVSQVARALRTVSAGAT